MRLVLVRDWLLRQLEYRLIRLDDAVDFGDVHAVAAEAAEPGTCGMSRTTSAIAQCARDHAPQPGRH